MLKNFESQAASNLETPNQISFGLINHLKQTILSSDFQKRHRLNSTGFTRKRKLPFPVLIYFLCNFLKKPLQTELDEFFDILNEEEPVAQRLVTKGALTKARKKLSHEAFIDLNNKAVLYFKDHCKPEKWNGFTLIAIDGSTLRVPRTEAVAEHFGQWHPENGDPCPIARVSQMFDVLNRVTLDAIIDPKEIGERELAAQHFVNLMPDDLFLFDRGYPCFWIFKLIVTLGAQFAARISVGNWNVVKDFLKSGKKDQIITLPAPSSSVKQCKEMGLDTEPMKLRLIKLKSKGKAPVVLITTLINKELYPYEIFDELYHMRWPVEDDYRYMKSRLEVENWSGKSVLSVYQDFHAKVFIKNLTTMLAHPIKPEIKKNCQGRKYEYQLNFTHALSVLKDSVVRLFNKVDEVVIYIINKIHEQFIKTTEPIRRGRKYPRKKKIRHERFSPCYKPIR